MIALITRKLDFLQRHGLQRKATRLCNSVSAERSSSQRSNFSLPRISKSPKYCFQPTFWNADGWYMQGKAKVIGKGVTNPQHHDRVLTKIHHCALQRLTRGHKRREPQWATWIECQKFSFRSWNPAEQLAGFQHLGHETAADGKPESELKVKPEEGCVFKKGRYNCIIQEENIIMPQRQEVLFERVLKEHRELKMCLVACISTTTLNQNLDL